MFNNNPVFEGKKFLHVSEPESLEKKYKDKLSPTAIDFMKGLLQLDPKKRLNSETVFKHKYFAYYEKEIESHKNKEENILNKDSKNMIPIEKNKSAIESENKVSNEKKEAKNSYQKIKLNKHKKLNSSGITIDFKNYVMGNNLMQSKNLNSYNNANILEYMKGNNEKKMENNKNNFTHDIKNNNSFTGIINLHMKENKKSKNYISKENSESKRKNSTEKDKKKILENSKSQRTLVKIKTFNSLYNRNVNKSMIYLEFKPTSKFNENFFLDNLSQKQTNHHNLKEYKNVTKYQSLNNLMSIPLPEGVINKPRKINKISIKKNNTIDNLLSNKKLNDKKGKYKKNCKDKILNTTISSNFTPSSTKNYFQNGYNTFYNKEKTINKKYYNSNLKNNKDEPKIYNYSLSPQHLYSNIIEEHEEYKDNNIGGITIKNFSNHNIYIKRKLKENRRQRLTKGNSNNNIFKKKLYFGMQNKKTWNLNLFETIYGSGGSITKKRDLELPQLIQIYGQKNPIANNKMKYDSNCYLYKNNNHKYKNYFN